MAERRMFARTIVDSDLFLDMPLSSQALYFHLGMQGDDDGFLANPRKIQRMVGATDDDMRLLIAKGFLIPFDSGVVVIRHWKIHNYIQSDRYKGTIFEAEKARLAITGKQPYELLPESDTACIQDVSDSVSSLDTVCTLRIGKDRREEERERICADSPEARPSQKRFAPPSNGELVAFMMEYAAGKDKRVDAAQEAERFIDFYSANGWKVGRNPMKDWHAAARNWLSKTASFAPVSPSPPVQPRRIERDVADLNDLYP